jgi:hypothetical protein
MFILGISLEELGRHLLNHVCVFLDNFRALKLDSRMHLDMYWNALDLHWTFKVCFLFSRIVSRK